jgi:hypothetical protein
MWPDIVYFIDFVVFSGQLMRMKLKITQWIAILFLSVVWLLSTAVVAQAASVLKSDVTVLATHTHLEIKTDQGIAARAELLNHPSRIVLDIEQLRLNHVLRKLSKLSWQNHARITNLRMSQFKSDTVRIVIDLKRPARFDLHQAETNKQMLITLDIYPAEEILQSTVEPQTVQRENATREASSELNSAQQEIETIQSQQSIGNSAGAQIMLDREPVFEPDLPSEDGVEGESAY